MTEGTRLLAQTELAVKGHPNPDRRLTDEERTTLGRLLKERLHDVTEVSSTSRYGLVSVEHVLMTDGYASIVLEIGLQKHLTEIIAAGQFPGVSQALAPQTHVSVFRRSMGYKEQ